jgi:hypothetical protein
MPPFGNRDSDAIFMRSSSSSSFYKDDTLYGMQENGVARPEDLKFLLNRMEQECIPADLISKIKGLCEKASEVGDMIAKGKRELVLAKAIDHSIGITLLAILDQIAAIFESEGDIKLVLSALTVSAVSRSFRFLDKLEKAVIQPVDEKLEGCLRNLLNAQTVDEQVIRVSHLSSSLSFEFVAGQSDMKQLGRSFSEDLPLTVSVTPVLFVQAADIKASSELLQQYNSCQVKIEYCSHKKLFSSSGSGVVGEAIVRVTVITANDAKLGGKGSTWSKGGDVGKLRVDEARCVQTNAFPRKSQAKADLYITSIHGLSGPTVTLKMRTYKSFNDEVANMDIQLVMEAPLQPSMC